MLDLSESESSGAHYGPHYFLPPEDSARLPRAVLLECLAKYRSFLAKAPEMDAIYAQFAVLEEGRLSSEELKRALEHIEYNLRPRDKREIWGIVVEMPVADEDVRLILSSCDVDDDGTLEKAEWHTALELWALLANQHLQENRKSSRCAIS